jgi:hypothetical protein
MRTLIEDPSFTSARDAISQDVRRMDQVMEGIGLRLSLHPDSGYETLGPGVWVTFTRPWPGAPRMAIYYTFDTQFVRLLDIELIDEPDKIQDVE